MRDMNAFGAELRAPAIAPDRAAANFADANAEKLRGAAKSSRGAGQDDGALPRAPPYAAVTDCAAMHRAEARDAPGLLKLVSPSSARTA